MEMLIVPMVFSAIIGGGMLVLLAIDRYLRRREHNKSE
jgi:hypothetical protein